MSAWSGEEFDFEGAGYDLNPTMISIYDALLADYHHEYNEGAEEVFDPREPAITDWVTDKIKHTYVRMNDRYKDCEFEYQGWIK